MSNHLKMAQEVVTEYAKKFAREYDVPSDAVEVVLVTGTKRGAEMEVRTGPVVQIILAWPAVKDTMNSKLHAAFSLIVRRRLWTPLEMPKRTYSYKVRDDKKVLRRWLANKAGKTPETEVLNLLAPDRVHVTMKTVIRYEDTHTGEFIEQEVVSKRPLNGLYLTPEWVELSTQVFTKYPEELLDDNDELPSHPKAHGDYSARDRGVAIVCRAKQADGHRSGPGSDGQASESRGGTDEVSHRTA